jgi:hypothetical protein
MYSFSIAESAIHLCLKTKEDACNEEQEGELADYAVKLAIVFVFSCFTSHELCY